MPGSEVLVSDAAEGDPRGRQSEARGTQPVQRGSDQERMHNGRDVGNCMANGQMKAAGI
jgi:hypothetical protein